MHREKRNFARLNLHAEANIHLDGQSIECDVENVSLKGVFVVAVCPVELNDAVAFTFSDIPISAKAKVVRVTDKGIGLQFENTILD